jgi:hypothetical protein
MPRRAAIQGRYPPRGARRSSPQAA